MKIKIDGDNLFIYVNNTELKSKDDIEDYIKDIIYKLRQKQKRKISGFYNVNIYQNDSFGLIIEMIREDELDFFPDIIDLKIIIHFDSEVYLAFDDYFLLKNKKEVYYYDDKYYINVKYFNDRELIVLSDFFTSVYGSDLKSRKNKFILLNN